LELNNFRKSQMKKLLLIFGLIISSNSWAEKITEQEVIAKVNQFFELLDIEVYKKEKVLTILTNDFQIFEMGKSWDMNEFDEFLQEASKTTITTDWVLTDFVVSIDENSAHVSYVNDGIFKTIDNELVISNWLESVYLIKEKGELKLKFLQSDLVSRETK
tara:strand:- start:104 stop:583 length:480 start_codon:yes stop_codon:yes gene_type:complete